MRSPTAKRILDNTPQERIDKVRNEVNKQIMIHSEENEGFDIAIPIKLITNAIGIILLIALMLLFLYLLSGNDSQPTTKPNQTQIQDKCPSNTFEPIKLTGSIGSVQMDSVTTDKLDFPMYSDLLGGKPKGWGIKK